MSSRPNNDFSRRKWRPYRPDDISRLYSKRRNGCWIWKGTVHKHSGLPLYKGWQYAHKLLWFRYCGWFPGRFSMPSCGNRLCVRPKHQRPFGADSKE